MQAPMINKVMRKNKFSGVSVVLLVVCVIVWVIGPFLSFNLLTTGEGEQFSVIEFIDHGKDYMFGEMTDTYMFTGILIVGITILLGFILLLSRLNSLAGAALLLGDIIFFVFILSIQNDLSEYVGGITDVAGASALGVAALLLLTGIVAIYTGLKNNKG